MAFTAWPWDRSNLLCLKSLTGLWNEAGIHGKQCHSKDDGMKDSRSKDSVVYFGKAFLFKGGRRERRPCWVSQELTVVTGSELFLICNRSLCYRPNGDITLVLCN